MDDDGLNEGISEQCIAKNLERKNPFIRRIRIIINWLENIAAESNNLKQVKEKMSAFSEKCFSWEHTLHHLKNLNNFARKDKAQFTGRDYVNELDPDAPIRLNKPLHDLDQEDEYKMMEYIFAFLRAGDLNSARDFCLKIGQSWRAATFEGFKLFNDENYSTNSTAFNNKQQFEIYKNEGNLNRDVWRLMVYRLIKNVIFI
jgi:nuclear pore complex protein Nup107